MLGNNIYNFRKKSGISQEYLAEKVKVSRQTISNWELGETSPNPEQLAKLADIFNISIDELLGHKVVINNINTISSKKDLALYLLVIIFAIAMVISLIMFFKEKDKHTLKMDLTTQPTTRKATQINNNDTFTRTFKIIKIDKVICDGTKSGCDDTTFNVIIEQCQKEKKELQISNSEEFKKLEQGKTYEFRFNPLVGEVFYEDNITSLFAFNSVIEIKETNKTCNQQKQDKIKTRSN